MDADKGILLHLQNYLHNAASLGMRQMFVYFIIHLIIVKQYLDTHGAILWFYHLKRMAKFTYSVYTF